MKFIKQLGLDFSDLVKRGISLVVIHVEMDYKYSLQSGERFMIGVILERVSPLRYRFLQDIYLLPEKKLGIESTGNGNRSERQRTATATKGDQ